MNKEEKQSKISRFTVANLRLGRLLAICSFLSLTLINPAIAEEKLLQTLTVTGNGSERIATTLTQVRLGVEIQGRTVTEVQQEVAKRTSAVVDLLRSKDISQLQTTGIRLVPDYDYSNNQRNLVGYIGTNTVSFRLQTELVGTLLDETVKAGATRIDGVSFTATPEAISEAQFEALRKATIDAQAMADAVLKTLNLTSKEIVSIQVNEDSVPPPQPIAAEALSREDAGINTPVIGGEQTVRASVTLQISY
ncbi:Membrane protein [Hyella patelloides LEGE 07179]|uniref:Membrane protein n=1 Tax=Hyella patelloides LEGE 07179 TaxID=945734 RepID=A0A563W1D9_9CYAN|nr:SIMPL domain-containing protein [Hyella patelloides]VEP17480.1 Membrane protein [Hyella patelloides LEGE 07179]